MSVANRDCRPHAESKMSDNPKSKIQNGGLAGGKEDVQKNHTRR
jgi:hypothetical protein